MECRIEECVLTRAHAGAHTRNIRRLGLDSAHENGCCPPDGDEGCSACGQSLIVRATITCAEYNQSTVQFMAAIDTDRLAALQTLNNQWFQPHREAWEHCEQCGVYTWPQLRFCDVHYREYDETS